MSSTSSTSSNSTDEKLKALAGLRINLASISDIHLNHPHTTTASIIQNLMKYAFPDTPETKKLDMIVIGGDVTDSLMEFASDNAVLLRAWVATFLKQCARNNTAVRVLEGTPLHDWHQSNIFVETNNNHDIGCDLLYIEDIFIERNRRFNLDILYIPDEIRPTTLETQRVVERLLVENQLTMVDFAFTHGVWPHHLPDIADVKDKTHDVAFYEKIVRHFIFNAHIHQHSQKGKVITNGSFDRLCHGDEGDKGHVRLMCGDLKFVQNLGAMRYKTLDVVGYPADEIIQKVGVYLGDNQSKAKIRLNANREDVASGLVRRLSNLFPFVRFDVSLQDKAQKRETRERLRQRKKSDLPALTRSNLISEWLKTIKEEYPDDVLACQSIVERVAHGVK